MPDQRTKQKLFQTQNAKQNQNEKQKQSKHSRSTKKHHVSVKTSGRCNQMPTVLVAFKAQEHSSANRQKTFFSGQDEFSGDDEQEELAEQQNEQKEEKADGNLLQNGKHSKHKHHPSSQEQKVESNNENSMDAVIEQANEQCMEDMTPKDILLPVNSRIGGNWMLGAGVIALAVSIWLFKPLWIPPPRQLILPRSEPVFLLPN